MHSSTSVMRILQQFRSLRYKLVIEGIGVGIVSAFVVIIFRLLLAWAEKLLNHVLSAGASFVWFKPMWFVCLLLAALIVHALLKWEPYISGSGIPQLEGEVNGHIHTCWWRVIVAKCFGGLLSIGMGLSLGREGPSIQLGAMAAKGFSRLMHRSKNEERLLLTCGASAGLAAAFNAPFAGVLFSLEEVHKNFSPEVLLSTMVSAITADFLSKSIFGLAPVFTIPTSEMLPISQYGHLVVLGIVLGFMGVLYNRSIAASQQLYGCIPNKVARIIIPFICAGIFAFTLPAMLGGGHHLVHEIAEGHFALMMLCSLFVLKFLFSMISFGSGAPGGIFLPLLVMGAMIGSIYFKFSESIFGIGGIYLGNFIILGMVGFFSAIVRAPVTGIILISEMTGSFSHMLSLSVVCLMAYLVPDLLHCKPIYEQLLARLLANGSEIGESGSEKIMIDTIVAHGSRAAEHRLSDMSWPDCCLVVSVMREDREIIPKGDTFLYGGDRLVLMCDEAMLSEVHYAIEYNCQIIP